MFTQLAADHGRETAANVAAGVVEPETAGELWLSYADASHEAGEAFLRAYDAAGGVR